MGMVVDHPPFDTTSTKATLNRVRNLDYTMPSGLSVEAENLIRRLLQSSPSKRPSLEELKSDPFLDPGAKKYESRIDSGIQFTASSINTFSSKSSVTRNQLTRSYERPRAH